MNARHAVCLIVLSMPACRDREPAAREERQPNLLRDYVKKPIDAAKAADEAVQEHNRRMREAAGEEPR